MRSRWLFLVFVAVVFGWLWTPGFVGFALGASSSEARVFRPVLERVGEARLWRVSVEARLESWWWGAGRAEGGWGRDALRELGWVEMALPVGVETKQSAALRDSARAEVRVGDIVIGRSSSVVEGSGAGGGLARVRVDRFDEIRGGEALVGSVVYEVVSSRLDIDEGLAAGVSWVARGEWDGFGEHVAAAMEPSVLIESDDEVVTELVQRWTGGEPRRVKPYVLAKHLARRVMESYELRDTDEGVGRVCGGRYVGGPARERWFTRRDPVTGESRREFGIKPSLRPAVSEFSFNALSGESAAAVARAGRGSEFGIHNLLCAVYRAAGLPARVVLGFDDRGAVSREPMSVVSWVEFFLAQPGTGRGEWVPVDIVRQEEASGRAPALDVPWPFFGRMRDGDRRAAVAVGWTVGESGPQRFSRAQRRGDVGMLWGWSDSAVEGAWPWLTKYRTFPSFGPRPVDRVDRERIRRAQRRVDLGVGGRVGVSAGGP